AARRSAARSARSALGVGRTAPAAAGRRRLRLPPDPRREEREGAALGLARRALRRRAPARRGIFGVPLRLRRARLGRRRVRALLARLGGREIALLSLHLLVVVGFRVLVARRVGSRLHERARGEDGRAARPPPTAAPPPAGGARAVGGA